MNLQEQEHWDYEMGAASDAQNAFSQSKMEIELIDPKIDEALGKGLFVVVMWSTAYCPSTDAVIGEKQSFVESFENLEDAEVCVVDEEQRLGWCDEMGFMVRPHGKVVNPDPPAGDNDDSQDAPF